MTFIVVGTNHKYSPIGIRERISFSKPRLLDALYFLKERNILKSAVILSTCNRVEIYAAAESYEIGKGEIENFISIYQEIDKRKISSYLYNYKDKQAIQHLFSVACGLDSLILGEIQVLGQAKKAFLKAQEAAFTGEILNEVFNSAFSVADRICTETKLSEGEVSVGSIAIDFIKEKVGALEDKNVLIIGMGKVTELVLKYLKDKNPKVVFISSRTYDKAKEFAARINADAVRFDNLKYFLKNADIIITATASPHFIIKKEALQETLKSKIIILDLALPRDVDPKVKELKNIELFHLEDLGTIIKKNIQKKSNQAQRARAIIDIEAEKLCKRITELEPEPALLQ